ncbi:MAG: oligosaccharide flippase family protein, partial [Candidatus Bathyarchaeia archaeon]
IKVIVRAGLLLNSAIGAVLSLATFLLSRPLAVRIFHQPELTVLIEVFSITLLAETLLLTAKSIFIGFERMEFHSLTMIIYSILRSLLAPLLVLLGFGALGAVLGRTATAVITGTIGLAIVLAVLLKDEGPGIALSHLRACKMLLSYGYPLFLSALFTGVLSRIYSFLMAVYVDASMIGNYQAATNFSVLIAFLTMPIATVLFPLFSKLDHDGSSTLRLVFQNSVKYAALITVPATMAVIALSDQLVRIIYGNSYQAAPLLLKLAVFNFLFVGLGNISVGNLLKGQARTRVIFQTHLINLCVGLPLSLTLIPRFGIIGLMLTTIIVPKPGLFYSLWWVKRNFGFTLNWAASAKIYLSAGLSFLLTSCLLAALNGNDWVDLVLGGSLFVLTYSLIAPSIGALERGDIKNLRVMLGGLGPLAALFNVFLTIVERLMGKIRPQ